MWHASRALILLAALLATFPGAAAAEQSSQPTSPAAGYMATGNFHSCAVTTSALRCWGFGGNGQLGYGNAKSIGDDETPSSAGPVELGRDRVARAISAGSVHTCALLDDGTVRCWGFGANGRLGYGNTDTIGDNEAPALAGPVDLDPGPGLGTAKAISAGNGHTCAILDGGAAEGTVRCWGFGLDGRLGYGNTDTIGDNETPGSVGPVDLDPDPDRVGKAKAIVAGGFHTCAILEDDSVRCWGFGGAGRLGYGNAGCPVPPATGSCPVDVGRTPETTPDKFGPVDLDPDPGSVGTAKAITAGLGYTCAILGNDTVRCWGSGGSGQLGYGDTQSIGDNETPDSKGPVDLDPGPGVGTAKAIDAGDEHTCVVLRAPNEDRVRCWGFNGFGQLGYGNTDDIGNTRATTPDTAGPVDLGAGRTATAITAGALHTCARLDDGSVRCWGRGSTGRLGYCKETTIGDNESPASVGPVDLGVAGMPGDGCPVVAPPPPSGGGGPAPVPSPAPTSPRPPSNGPLAPAPDPLDAALAAQKARATALSTCLQDSARKLETDRRKASRLPSSKRRGARRQAEQRAARRRTVCRKRHGRTPGRVTVLAARGMGSRKILLAFRVVGTDGSRAPGARSYVVKQSRRPIRTARDFARAPSLCKGKCSFKVTRVGASATLTITDLRRGLYYYAIAARDNVSGRTGPRSMTIKARAR